MKKSIWLTILLFILGTGILCAATILIDAKKEVVLTEKTLYGDKSVTQGLQVEMNVNSNKRLHWNIKHQFGDNLTETKFKVGKRYAKETPIWSWRYSEGIRLELGVGGMGSSQMGSYSKNYEDGAAGAFASHYQKYGMEEIMKEMIGKAAAKAPAGQEYKEFFYLKDYMDVYPFLANMYLLGGVGDIMDAEGPEMSFARQFREYFQIPIQDGYGIEVSIGKDDKGTIQSISVSDGESADRPQIENFTVVTDYGCYFAFQERNGNQRLFDTSRLPEYGLYYIPYIDNTSGSKWMYFENLCVPYPMDSFMRLEQLALSKDGKQIYMLVYDRDILKFIALDAKTTEVKQTIDLVRVQGRQLFGNFNLSYEYENFIAINIVGDKHQTIVLEKNGQGEFEYALTADTEEILKMGVYYGASSWGYDNIPEWTDAISNTTMAWDGEKLAIASFQWNHYYLCNFHLAVYDQSGLLYCGEYQNSLISNEDMAGFASYNSCVPDETDIWSMSWQ